MNADPETLWITFTQQLAAEFERVPKTKLDLAWQNARGRTLLYRANILRRVARSMNL